MSSIWDWSLSSANNANADSSINWAEGQNPSTVNDSARTMMQRIKELLNDLSGIPVASGTANTITLTLASPITAYADGIRGSFKASADNTGAVTLNVNVIGAKPLLKFTAAGETNLLAGEVKAGCIYEVVYVSALNSADGGWLLLNPTPQGVPVGTIITLASAVTPTGYLPLAGGLYSRTTYAALWAHASASGNMATSDATWSSAGHYGRYSPGNGSTTFRLPDPRGYFMRVFDGGRGIDPGRAIGAFQEYQNAAHTHGVTDPGHIHKWGWKSALYSLLGGNVPSYAQTSPTDSDLSTETAYTGISIQSSGGNEARPKSIAWPLYVKY